MIFLIKCVECGHLLSSDFLFQRFCFNTTLLCFVSSSSATGIQLNFHSNLLCTYASRLKRITS